MTTAPATALATFNAMSDEAARSALLACCGSRAWAAAVAQARPFADESALFDEGDRVWRRLERADWLEAFAAHPRIGSRRDVDKQAAATKAWASGEQAGADLASKDTLDALAEMNREYEARFGYIYIVCATDKSAEEMLDICRVRLANPADVEIGVAAEEQRKITRIRLEKMLRAPGSGT